MSQVELLDESVEIEITEDLAAELVLMKELFELHVVFGALDLRGHVCPLEVFDCLDDAVDILLLLKYRLFLRVQLQNSLHVGLHYKFCNQPGFWGFGDYTFVRSIFYWSHSWTN